MQFSHAIIALAAATLASAQIPPIPQCALSCFANTLTTDGCSGLTDYKCHCAKPQLVSEVTPCVQKNCSPADQSSASSIVVSICSSVGEPISVPAVGGGSTSSAAAAASTTAAASSSMATSAMSTSMAAGCGGSTPMASSSPAPMSSAASAPASSSAAATSSAMASGSSTASASATQFTGAAVQNKGNMAGVAAIAAAAAYLL